MYVLPRGSGAKDSASVLPLLPRPSFSPPLFHAGILVHTREIPAISTKSVGRSFAITFPRRGVAPRDRKGEEEFDTRSKLVHSITKTNHPPLPSIDLCKLRLYKDTWILEGAVNDETEDVVGEFYRMAKFLMGERGGGGGGE